jgi:hypothetical protein
MRKIAASIVVVAVLAPSLACCGWLVLGNVLDAVLVDVPAER